jgi:hypothetical protein
MKRVNRKKVAHLPGVTLLVLLLVCMNCYGQEKPRDDKPGEKVNAEVCPDPAPETSGSHRFRKLGETIEIPVRLADCQAVSLELQWANGRNNGSNFKVTFLDNTNRPVFSKNLFGFMSGTFELPFSKFYSRRYFGSRSLITVPESVTIEAVSPFAYPANLSYTVTRVPRNPRPKQGMSGAASPAGEAETGKCKSEKETESQKKPSE